MTSHEIGRNNPRKSRIPENFPCYKEKNQSMMCLQNNNFDYSKCQKAFDNFNFCTKFWDIVTSQRKSANIKPFLPEADEREVIMKHYLKTGSLPESSQQPA